MIRKTIFFWLGWIFLSLIPVGVHATDGIGIAPALQEVVLNESDAQAQFEMVVSNNTGHVVEFRLSTLDFGALDESGGVAFLGRSGQETYAYSLSEWMELDRDRVSVEPGKTETITVTISNDASLSPGGHYGAVMVTAPSDGQASGDSIAVLPGASTLVLLKKIGGENYDLKLDSIKANKSLLKLPKSVDLIFYSAGNVHAVPRGTIELSGPFNSRIGMGVINESSAFVLPESNRAMSVDINQVKQPWLPGRYALTIQWRHDDQEHFSTQVIHQWYLGRLGVIILLAISLLVVLYLFISYKKRPVTRN